MNQEEQGVQNFRQGLKKSKQEKREARSIPSKNYISFSGRTSGDNPLLSMISCSENASVRNLRIFIPDLEEGQWLYGVSVGTGITSYPIVGMTKLRKGFTLIPEFRLLPNEVATIRAHYRGEVIEDFEYCLDYALEVK